MWKKLFLLRIWKRIYIERLGEPIIYNLVSIFVFIFGGFRKKIDYDLVPRQPYAFGLKDAFEISIAEECSKVIIIEFGVSSGAGLYNLAYIADKLSSIYAVDYQIIGFDSGEGMPKPIDYRDHPEKFRTGDYPPLNLDINNLPKKTKVYYGDISDTLVKLDSELSEDSKIGFVSIDVDYYSSTEKCLKVFKKNHSSYLSKTVVYLDDVNNVDHNDYCGELLAINEFNENNLPRKICKMTQLRNWRIFKNALYLDQMYYLHVFDSDYRNPDNWNNKRVVNLYNPYLSNEKA